MYLLLFVVLHVSLAAESDSCRFAFVTSNRFVGGSLNGREGGDGRCQAAAYAGNLPAPDSFYAYLSVSSSPARDYLLSAPGAVDGCWKRTDNSNLIIANDMDDLVNYPSVPIKGDEYGNEINSLFATWTGTDKSGKVSAGTCDGWTSTGASGTFGRADASGTSWCAHGSFACAYGVEYRLYCFSMVNTTLLNTPSPTISPSKLPTLMPSVSPTPLFNPPSSLPTIAPTITTTTTMTTTSTSASSSSSSSTQTSTTVSSSSLPTSTKTSTNQPLLTVISITDANRNDYSSSNSSNDTIWLLIILAGVVLAICIVSLFMCCLARSCMQSKRRHSSMRNSSRRRTRTNTIARTDSRGSIRRIDSGGSVRSSSIQKPGTIGSRRQSSIQSYDQTYGNTSSMMMAKASTNYSPLTQQGVRIGNNNSNYNTFATNFLPQRLLSTKTNDDDDNINFYSSIPMVQSYTKVKPAEVNDDNQQYVNVPHN